MKIEVIGESEAREIIDALTDIAEAMGGIQRTVMSIDETLRDNARASSELSARMFDYMKRTTERYIG